MVANDGANQAIAHTVTDSEVLSHVARSLLFYRAARTAATPCLPHDGSTLALAQLHSTTVGRERLSRGRRLHGRSRRLCVDRGRLERALQHATGKVRGRRRPAFGFRTV